MKTALLSLCCFLLLHTTGIAQVVVKGEANLESYHFEEQGAIALDGEWCFQFEQYLSYEEASERLQSPQHFLPVPMAWYGQVWDGKALPGKGFGTYAIKLKLPENHQGLALKVTDASNACRIYVNEHLVSTVGQAGTSRDATIPHSKSHIIPIHSQESDIILRIQMANFHYRVGGLWESIYLGTETALSTQRYRITMQTVLITGIALAFLCYHLGLFYLRRQNRSYLYFALFCLTIALRLLSSDQMIILDFFPNLSWFWRIRMDVFSFYLSVPTSLLFTRSVFPAEFPKKLTNIIIAIGISTSICCLITPADFYSQLIPYYRYYALAVFVLLIYGFVNAIQRNRNGSILLASAAFIFVIFAIHDILLGANVIESVELVSYGIVILIIAKAMVLSKQFVTTFHQAELLSTKLQNINQELEEKVKVRTKEIEEKNQILAQKNQYLTVSEEELVQSTEELKIINTNLEQAKREIEKMLMQEQKSLKALKEAQAKLIQSEKMASLGQMTAGIAHEINNPINFVTGGAQSIRLALQDLARILKHYEELKDLSDTKDIQKKLAKIASLEKQISFEETKEEVANLVEDIEMGAQRTAEIVKGLQNFSRSTQAQLTLSNLHEGIDSCLVILRHKYKDHIQIMKDYDPNLQPIYCYFSQLNQVFMNLINNAIDAIAEKGTIEIITKSLANTLEIRIKDSGSGIPPDILPKIFDPFFTTKEVGKGTGLGLSISYGVIEHHQGTMEVENTSDKGTTFLITLPKSTSKD
ncbi:MAG: ATP-binding protein [Flammeovirgaceae bacterium]